MGNIGIKIKLSTWVLILLILQIIYMEFGIYGCVVSSFFTFDILHEDTIMIMHVMTWFIVRSIENLK